MTEGEGLEKGDKTRKEDGAKETVAETRRQVAARTTPSAEGSGSGTQTEKDHVGVLKGAVTVALTKEGSICKISPPRLLITQRHRACIFSSWPACR